MECKKVWLVIDDDYDFSWDDRGISVHSNEDKALKDFRERVSEIMKELGVNVDNFGNNIDECVKCRLAQFDFGNVEIIAKGVEE